MSVTRLGNFLNFLVTNFITKVTQMMSDFFGRCFLRQSGEVNFWAPFGTTWATFYFNIWSHWIMT